MNEVRIYDKDGTLKRIISSETLLKQHWKNYKEGSGKSSIALRKKQKAEAKAKTQARLEANAGA